jgi:glutamyl-tRNA reductase
MSDDINRRDFMKRAALSTAAVSISMAGLSTTRVLGANDRLRLGVIGTGRQGIDNMQHFIRQGVEAAAVSDCYAPRAARRKPTPIFAS